MLSGVVPNSLNTHSGSLSQCALHFLLKVRGEPGTFKSLGILMETTLEVKQEKESTGCYAIGYIPAPPPPIEACAFGKKNYRSDSHPDIKFPSITTTALVVLVLLPLAAVCSGRTVPLYNVHMAKASMCA